MKKILFAAFAVTLGLFSCSDDDEPNPPVDKSFKLAQEEETLEAKAGEVEIKAEGYLNWKIDEVAFSDSSHVDEILEPEAPTDTLKGIWFEVIRKDNGAFLEIKVDDNEEEQRKLSVLLTTETDTTTFDLIQNSVVVPEPEE